VDKWVVIGAAIPASGVFAWIAARFIDWRRRLRASMWSDVQGKG
jgi:hypothetical protein